MLTIYIVLLPKGAFSSAGWVSNTTHYDCCQYVNRNLTHAANLHAKFNLNQFNVVFSVTVVSRCTYSVQLIK